MRTRPSGLRDGHIERDRSHSRIVNSLNVIGVIQARMSSTRLPGKVLLEAAGRPVILHMLERLSQCPTLSGLWVATSTESSDDPLHDAVARAGYPVFRGSLENVLSRYWEIGRLTHADAVVRLTGDCPLHDPAVIDEVVSFYLENPEQWDYVSNVMPPTYPDGLDTELFSLSVLDEAYDNAKEPFDLEHVTPWIRRVSRKRGRMANVTGPADFSHLRWTLDEPDDYELIKQVFHALAESKKDFGWLDVVAWMTKKPERFGINAKHERNEGSRETGSPRNLDKP